MTNEQILWLARVRVGLQKADIRVDLVRVTRDRPYLEAVLNRASELTDETAVEFAMKLMMQLGMINGSRAMDPARELSITRQNVHGSPLDSPTQMGLRGSLPPPAVSASPGTSASSQPDLAPIERGQFSTPIGLTTGTTGAPVPGGKSYKRGLR